MKVQRYADERVMVFIDYRNITESLLNIAEHRISRHYHVDFEKLTDDAVGDRKLVGAFVFDGTLACTYDSDKRIHDELRMQGFTVDVRENDIQERIQKGVDVSLAISAVKHALKDHYDTAIIISGDKDFIPAIETIRDEGKKVEGVSFYHSTSDDFIRSCNEWYSVDEFEVIDIDDKLRNKMLESIPKEEVLASE